MKALKRCQEISRGCFEFGVRREELLVAEEVWK